MFNREKAEELTHKVTTVSSALGLHFAVPCGSLRSVHTHSPPLHPTWLHGTFLLGTAIDFRSNGLAEKAHLASSLGRGEWRLPRVCLFFSSFLSMDIPIPHPLSITNYPSFWPPPSLYSLHSARFSWSISLLKELLSFSWLLPAGQSLTHASLIKSASSSNNMKG